MRRSKNILARTEYRHPVKEAFFFEIHTNIKGVRQCASSGVIRAENIDKARSILDNKPEVYHMKTHNILSMISITASTHNEFGVIVPIT